MDYSKWDAVIAAEEQEELLQTVEPYSHASEDYYLEEGDRVFEQHLKQRKHEADMTFDAAETASAQQKERLYKAAAQGYQDILHGVKLSGRTNLPDSTQAMVLACQLNLACCGLRTLQWQEVIDTCDEAVPALEACKESPSIETNTKMLRCRYFKAFALLQLSQSDLDRREQLLRQAEREVQKMRLLLDRPSTDSTAHQAEALDPSHREEYTDLFDQIDRVLKKSSSVSTAGHSSSEENDQFQALFDELKDLYRRADGTPEYSEPLPGPPSDDGWNKVRPPAATSITSPWHYFPVNL